MKELDDISQEIVQLQRCVPAAPEGLAGSLGQSASWTRGPSKGDCPQFPQEQVTITVTEPGGWWPLAVYM